MNVFVTGGTGYLGRPLIVELVRRGHPVRALVRPGSEGKVPAGATAVIGDVLRADTWDRVLEREETLVHLVGTPHPNPSKGAEFKAVDLASIRAACLNATVAGVRHIVYVSVAHPAPVMHAYIAVRQEGEAVVRATGIPATILRPWYVLGPGHWWPYALLPLYAVASVVPSMKGAARRLGLVTRKQMVTVLVQAVEAPPAGERIIEVPQIRSRGN